MSYKIYDVEVSATNHLRVRASSEKVACQLAIADTKASPELVTHDWEAEIVAEFEDDQALDSLPDIDEEEDE